MPLALDDYEHIGLVTHIQRGDMPLSTWLLAPHNGHWIPLWKIWHALNWWVFGIHSTGWLATPILLQWLSACLIYLLCRQSWPTSPLAAQCASALWAACSTLGSDHPVFWVGASHLVFATTGWLLTLVLMGHLAVTRRPTLVLIALSVALVASVLCMGSFAWIMPTVALHGWLVALPRADAARRRTVGQAMTLVLVLSTLFVVAEKLAFAWSSSILRGWQLSGRIILWYAWDPKTYWNMIKLAANSFGRLLGFPSTISLTLLAEQSSLLLLLGLGGITLWLRPQLRGLWPILLAVGLVAWATAISRAHAGALLPLFGRYLYLPALAWCFVVASWTEALARRWPRRHLPPAGQALVCTLFLGLAIHQLFLARQDLQVALYSYGRFRPLSEALVELARTLDEHQPGITMLDIPVLQPTSRFYVWSVLLEVEGASNALHFVPPEEWDETRLEIARLALQDSRHQEARTIWATLVQADMVAQILRAAQETDIRRLPNVEITYFNAAYRLDQVVWMLYSGRMAAFHTFTFVEGEAWTEEDGRRFEMVLERLPGPVRSRWRQALAGELAPDPSPPTGLPTREPVGSSNEPSPLPSP